MKYLIFILILFILLPLNVLAQTKAVVDITNMSITDLADALDKGYLTSELLVTLYLERIDVYNENFNAIREINEDAINEAKKLDQERLEGKVRSVLHGIPIVVKTNIDVEGLATTAGSLALDDNYPIKDAEVVKKLRDAGAIILASTNMSEFAFSAGNSNSSYGQVKNAFNTSYTPYGSSGGSAVAIATSMAAAALGTDTNSSVRIPASAAGLVGIRPSMGLVNNEGIIPYDITRDTVGVLAKTVEDNALIFSVINEKNNNYSLTKKTLNGLKIGVIDSYLKGTDNNISINQKTDEDIYQLAKEKIEILRDLGAEIINVSELINSYYYNIAINTMGGGSFCDGFNNYINGSVSNVKSFNDLVNSSEKIYNLNGYLEECGGMWIDIADDAKTKEFEDYILGFFDKYDLDLIVYPTTKNKVYQITNSGVLKAPGSFLESVIGYPSITVTMGYIDEFPYGLEFFSLRNKEQLLYEVANLFEKENGLFLVNSNLTPALYNVPEYINELKYYYEKGNNKLDNKAKEYFLNYSQNSDLQNEIEAKKLIQNYKELDFLNMNKNRVLLINVIILSLLSILFIVFIIIYYKWFIIIKNFYFKFKK